jgi:hypothetical protein
MNVALAGTCPTKQLPPLASPEQVETVPPLTQAMGAYSSGGL